MKLKTDAFKVAPRRRVRLSRLPTGDTHPWASKSEVAGRIEADLDRLFRLQELLYADNRWSLLIVIQAMDAAGKDSAIKHVMRGLNPQGTRVASFKSPSAEDLDHDFLWRIVRELPGRGEIGVFNRSHYEEVLIVRVHPEILAGQRLPETLVTKRIWQERFDDINAFERHLVRSGTVVRKFFLHVSRREQRDRFLARLDDPAKNWKFSLDDVKERDRWDDYMRAYEEMLGATSTDGAPWYVVPADHKWYAHLVMARIIIEALEELKLEFPVPTPAQRRGLSLARRQLASKNTRG